jgi:AcrR family transcriptional regulator
VSTDERILQAATTLFRDRGFHGVGVAEIGREAGVTGPAIYRHFSGKDEILLTLFERASARLLLRTRLDEEADPWARLDGMVDAVLAWCLRERDLVLVFHREQRFVGKTGRRRVRRAVDEHLARWHEIITACRPELAPGEVRALVWGVNELLLSVAEWPRDLRERADLSRLVRGLVHDGVRGSACA